MDVLEAIKKRRSVRSFSQEPVDRDLLIQMIDAARVGPSAANRQCLKYVVVTEPELCAEVFKNLKWAAYTAPVGTPAPGFTPTAYVAVCVLQKLALPTMAKYDAGAAIQTIMLLGTARGVDSCWLKAVNYPEVSKLLNLPEGVELDSVVALGKPAEEPTQVDLEEGKEGVEVIKYWRDENSRQFVPKRALGDVLVWEKF